MRVDFHVHSTASDGTFSPTEIVAKARGLVALALTDHDNCDGIEEFKSCASLASGQESASTLVVAGIELSIEPGKGFDRFHLLGLGIDPDDVGLKSFLKRILDGRNARNARIIDNFRRLGIELAGVEAYAHGEVLARPHFARWLMDHGFVTSVADAFEKYLLPDSPHETRCYEERWHPAQEDAFRAIHGAGGLCVMAHPKYWRTNWKTSGCDFAAAERELAALGERGLDGVETLYQANTGEENVEFTRIATKFGYLKSAGSDFHGANKPHIPLGMEVSDAFIAPLLERLGKSGIRGVNEKCQTVSRCCKSYDSTILDFMRTPDNYCVRHCKLPLAQKTLKMI